MTAEFRYFADRALQEAIRAIDAKPGAAARAHEELTRAYSARVVAELGQRDRAARRSPFEGDDA